MGWKFRWVSSAASDFNFDYHVSFPKARARAAFSTISRIGPIPRSTSFRASASSTRTTTDEGDRTIYHTYSTYGRGGEMFLPVYGWLDVVPKGRNETKNGNLTDWVRRHDRYENDGRTRQSGPEMADAS